MTELEMRALGAYDWHHRGYKKIELVVLTDINERRF